MKKIKAPIDGKNVTTDWIEEIFDHYNAVGCTDKYGTERICGYVANTLIESTFFKDYNTIMWRIHSLIAGKELKSIKDELTKRLKEHEDPDRELFSEIKDDNDTLWQSFYWRQED